MSDGDEPQPGCSRDPDNPLKNWTREEKFDLLLGLKAKGSHDINGITTYLPEKTKQEIKAAIAFYKAKSIRSVNISRKKKQMQKDLGLKAALPLSMWARLLVESVGFNELQTEVATALRIIADFEDIPEAALTENIDFKTAYHLLANAVEGKALQDDKYITALLKKSLVESVLTSKAFIRPAALLRVINNVVLTDKVVKRFSKLGLQAPEAAAIRNLCMQRNFNPLNISEELMKPNSR